ncbi:Sec-independent protein translocase protein TatA [Dissostichus eleginoides]|uniref:Sec-independent protein translocase protein TatA n=1 Tax=Dissostichus eleginoides TaxID=100907 RepID=A0AAD9F1F3_DISEL|nr:Sec-independent protein translocase protein TatA [Dissostichus eleginoides]
MSQSGKVLHLYVEVRSAPDQAGGKEGIAQGHSVQDSPAELLSQLASQTSITKTSTAQRLLQDCKHNQSPYRNVQLQQASSSPTVSKRWSAPCDGASAFHSPQKMSSSGKVDAPHTPPNCQRFNEGKVSDGTRSVVTFSYIEKSNVNSPCKRGTIEERSTPSHFRKRLSDPIWFGSPNSSCSSSPKQTFRSPGSHQQTFSPGLRQSALDPIGRAATQRAVEEFGSPLLRIKLAHALEQAASSRYNQQPRCQSWAGSPVQRQNMGVLKDHFTERSPGCLWAASEPCVRPAILQVQAVI